MLSRSPRTMSSAKKKPAAPAKPAPESRALSEPGDGLNTVAVTGLNRFLGADVFPQIGKLPIRSVTAAHLLELIRKIEKRGAETVALLVRQWCSANAKAKATRLCSSTIIMMFSLWIL